MVSVQVRTQAGNKAMTSAGIRSTSVDYPGDANFNGSARQTTLTA